MGDEGRRSAVTYDLGKFWKTANFTTAINSPPTPLFKGSALLRSEALPFLLLQTPSNPRLFHHYSKQARIQIPIYKVTEFDRVDSKRDYVALVIEDLESTLDFYCCKAC